MGVVADFNDKIAIPICSVDLLTCDEFEAFDGRENFFGQLHKTELSHTSHRPYYWRLSPLLQPSGAGRADKAPEEAPFF